MTSIDKITDKEVKGIHLIIWKDGHSLTMIESVCFDFGNLKLTLNADKDSDSIEYVTSNNFELSVTDDNHKIIDCHSYRELGLDSVLGKKLIWFWKLTNDQGYQDGIQMEFNDDNSFQFLVVASDIKIRRIVIVNLPSR